MVKIQSLILVLVIASFSGCLEEFLVNEEDGNIPQKGLSKHCISFDGKERCWLILIPENIDFTKKNPLIIDMHGIGGSMYLQHNLTRFANISEEYGVYVAYPQGFNNEWNMADDLCCGDDDDFGFILEMIETIKQKYIFLHIYGKTLKVISYIKIKVISSIILLTL